MFRTAQGSPAEQGAVWEAVARIRVALSLSVLPALRASRISPISCTPKRTRLILAVVDRSADTLSLASVSRPLTVRGSAGAGHQGQAQQRESQEAHVVTTARSRGSQRALSFV